ncbi:response regulator [uncultured Amnibacterium sp.]|uniref:response regulator n=1 Tax=uncultured Amnibacterium sp. TaxID=1631851 RepID=UPI0035CC49C9
MSIRVALVDDQQMFRRGVSMIVRSQPDLEVVGEAGNGEEAIALVDRERPDVVLMDVRMPVLDGVAATKRILESAAARGETGPRIIVLTTFDLDADAASAIRAGASGFVLKDADPDFLIAAIRTVHAGTAVVAASATRALLERFEPAERRPVPQAFGTLTGRERDVFAHAAKGLSNSEIARTEYVSEATVKTHISNVLTKLALRDRVQLVVFAYENGLVDR